MTPPKILDRNVRPLDPKSKKAIQAAIKALEEVNTRLIVDTSSADFMALILSGVGPYHVAEYAHALRSYRQRAGRKAKSHA